MKSKSHIYMLLMGLSSPSVHVIIWLFRTRCQEACKIQIKYLKT